MVRAVVEAAMRGAMSRTWLYVSSGYGAMPPVWWQPRQLSLRIGATSLWYVYRAGVAGAGASVGVASSPGTGVAVAAAVGVGELGESSSPSPPQPARASAASGS